MVRIFDNPTGKRGGVKDDVSNKETEKTKSKGNQPTIKNDESGRVSDL